MSGLAPLRYRSFRFLVGGQLASNLGDACYTVALPWYVLAAHNGPVLLATVLAAYGVPRTVSLALGGHASDRWGPWTTMMVADLVRLTSVGALAIVALSSRPHAAILVPIAALTGACEGLFLPGSFSIVPALLADDALQAGNAISSSTTQLATFVGPAVGGALVAVLGPASAFFADAASFALSAMSLAGVRSEMLAQATTHLLASTPTAQTSPAGPGAKGPEASGHEQPVPTLRQLVRSEKVLRVIFLVTLAANLGLGGVSSVALPALAHGPLHTGAGGYGELVAAFGAGALIGTVLAGQVRRLERPAPVASVAFLASALAMTITPYLRPWVLVATGLFVYASLIGFGNVLTVTAIQRWAPPALLGRLWGVLLLASFGLFPLSVALAGLVVRTFGPAPVFPMAAVVLAGAVLVGLTQKSWRDFGPNAAAKDRFVGCDVVC